MGRDRPRARTTFSRTGSDRVQKRDGRDPGSNGSFLARGGNYLGAESRSCARACDADVSPSFIRALTSHCRAVLGSDSSLQNWRPFLYGWGSSSLYTAGVKRVRLHQITASLCTSVPNPRNPMHGLTILFSLGVPFLWRQTKGRVGHPYFLMETWIPRRQLKKRLLLHTFSDLIFEHFRKFFHTFASAQTQCFQWHHVVLVHRSVASRCGMSARIDDFENGELRLVVLTEQRVQLLVREQERVRTRSIWVKINDVSA